MTPSTRATSSTLRAKGPAWSEGRAVGDQAVARDTTVARFNGADAAERRRLADAAAGISAQRSQSQIRRHRRRAAAAAAAGHPLDIPGIARREVGAVLSRRAHGEFVHIQLAQHHRARLAQPSDSRGVKDRLVAFENLGAAGGLDAFGGQHIFQRRWGCPATACRRRQRAPDQPPPPAPRAQIGRDRQISADGWVDRFNALQMRLGQFARADLAGAHQLRQRSADGQAGELGHSGFPMSPASHHGHEVYHNTGQP